ncbi:MAG: hypothetical protein Q8Q31_02795 [Nanoarchaeota archaeon]|nr:hypothetical protein [Nanoarchaeota archaeon]
MKLKPSMRSNRRYLLVETKDKKEIEKVILDYLGILGLAKMNLLVVKENKGKILFSIEREEVENFRAALECSQIDAKILRVSGTIKGMRKNETFN